MEERQVHITVVLPESEREAFDRFCRYDAKPKVSMNRVIRELMRAAIAGEIRIHRDKLAPPTKAKAPDAPAKRRKRE